MEPQPSWLEKLSLDQPSPTVGRRKANPWRRRLGAVRGEIDRVDGIERISCAVLYAVLELSRAERNAPTKRRICSTMIELGWEPVRARGLTLGKSHQVRCYIRKPRFKP